MNTVISDLAVQMLLTVYTTFVLSINIKTKYRSFLKNVENVFLPALANRIKLQVDDMCKNYQVHPSLSSA